MEVARAVKGIGVIALLVALLGVVAGPVTAQPSTTTTPVGPSLSIVSAVNGSLALTSVGPSFDAVVTVRATGRMPEAAITVTAFRDQAGETFTAEAKPQRAVFENGEAIVRVTAPLPFGGPFVSELTATAGQLSQKVTLTVTRTRAATPVMVDGVENQSNVSWGRTAKTVQRRITITETTARAIELQPLVVVAPVTTVTDQSTEADIEIVEANRMDDSQRCQVSGLKVTIEPGAACTLLVKMRVPAGAGTYSGAIRLQAAGFGAVDFKMKVQIKRGWFLALVFIGLGVVLAVILKKILLRGRDALGVRINIARARDDLTSAERSLSAPPPDEDELRLAQGLHALLDGADDDARAQRTTDAQVRLARARKQIACFRAWVALHRALRDASDTVQARLSQQWTRLTGELVDPGLDDDRAAKLAGELEELRKALGSSARQELLAEVERFAATLERLDLGADGASITALVAEAKKEASNDQGLASRAAKLLLDAQSLVADVLADRIAGFIAVGPGALGFTVTTDWWFEFSRQIEGQLREALEAPPEQKLRLLNSAELSLLKRVSTQFRSNVANAMPKPESKAPGDEKQRTALKPVVDALDRVDSALREKKLADASAAYEDARKASAAATAAGVQHLGTNSSEAATALPICDLGPPPTITNDPGPSSATPVRPSRDDLDRKLDRIQWLLIGLAAVVAIIAGVATLYNGKATWGTPGDWVTAVLWGLGITAAGNGIAGFGGALDTLTK